MDFTLEIAQTPPSFNARMVGGGKVPWQYIKTKKAWEGNLMIMLIQAKVPRHLNLVVASADMIFKSKRKRDEGNYRVMLEKAFGDTLVAGGWLPDDTPDHYRFERVTIAETTGDPKTVVRLKVER